MYLYALTLQKSGGVLLAVYGMLRRAHHAPCPRISPRLTQFSGNFSAPKAQEIVLGHGKVLELIRPDPETGKLTTVYSSEIFGLIRSLVPFRLTGTYATHIIIAND